MNKRMNLDDLQKLSQNMAKGVSINVPVIKAKLPNLEHTEPISKAAGLIFIESILNTLNIEFINEFQFSKPRKFRADIFLINHNVIIEYEGINSAKSRHTSIKGYTNDCEKYNIAQIKGYWLLRYTALNYKEFEQNIIDLLKIKKLS